MVDRGKGLPANDFTVLVQVYYERSRHNVMYDMNNIPHSSIKPKTTTDQQLRRREGAMEVTRRYSVARCFWVKTEGT